MTTATATKVKVVKSLLHCEKCGGNQWVIDKYPVCFTCHPVEGDVKIQKTEPHWPRHKRVKPERVKVKDIEDMIIVMTARAWNCYDSKVAWALKREIREDLKLDRDGAIEKWRPFVENTLGVNR